MKTWTTEVVDELVVLKRGGGVSFDQAWRQVLATHPPRGRDVGPSAPTLFASLEEPAPVEFLRRACSDAWHGERPELRILPLLMETGEVFPRAESFNGRRVPARSAV